MSKHGLWYFAHPYTAKDAAGDYVPAAEEANFNLCCIRAAELLQMGYNVYAPISHTHPIHIRCPRFLRDHEHDMWYGLDDEVIAKTEWQGIILAPGWASSSGCLHELTLFKKRGLKILYYAAIVAEHYNDLYEVKTNGIE